MLVMPCSLVRGYQRLKGMEVIRSSKTLISTYETTCCHNPETTCHIFNAVKTSDLIHLKNILSTNITLSFFSKSKFATILFCVCKRLLIKNFHIICKIPGYMAYNFFLWTLVW